MYLKGGQVFISLSSLASEKSLPFCVRTLSCAHTNDMTIVSRDEKCNTEESSLLSKALQFSNMYLNPSI